MVQRVEQDRRGDVVGQVADQADRRTGGQRGEVHLQHVAVDDAQLAHACGHGRQRADQVAVELDHGQRAVAAQQWQGDRALAGADLDQAFARCQVHGLDDALDIGALVQEVLSQ